MDEEDNLQKVEVVYHAVLDDIAEYSLFLLWGIYDAFPVHGDRLLKDFWEDKIHKLFRPKLIQMEEAHEQFLQEHNSTEGDMEANN